MPEYAGKSYPYTPEGIAAYEKAKAEGEGGGERSVRGEVRRREQGKKTDASEQRIQDIIEELSTTQKYPTGDIESEDFLMDTLARSGETRAIPDSAPNMFHPNRREPIPFDPVRREPEITSSGRGRNIFGWPLPYRRIGRAALDPEERVMDNPIPPADWQEVQRKRPDPANSRFVEGKSPIEGVPLEEIMNRLQELQSAGWAPRDRK